MPRVLRNKAYEHIRAALISGRVQPGSRLSDLRISQNLGISRTPVRQALDRLKREGLVANHPKGGYMAQRPSLNELVQLFELREMIECHAIRWAARHITPAELDELDAVVTTIRHVKQLCEVLELHRLNGDLAERLDHADAKFHLLILRASGQHELIETVRTQHVMTRVFGHRHYVPTRNAVETLTLIAFHHQAILDALRAGDADEAERAMRTHLLDARRLISDHRRSLGAELAKRPEVIWGDVGDWTTAHRLSITDLEDGLGEDHQDENGVK